MPILNRFNRWSRIGDFINVLNYLIFYIIFYSNFFSKYIIEDRVWRKSMLKFLRCEKLLQQFVLDSVWVCRVVCGEFPRWRLIDHQIQKER